MHHADTESPTRTLPSRSDHQCCRSPASCACCGPNARASGPSRRARRDARSLRGPARARARRLRGALGLRRLQALRREPDPRGDARAPAAPRRPAGAAPLPHRRHRGELRLAPRRGDRRPSRMRRRRARPARPAPDHRSCRRLGGSAGHLPATRHELPSAPRVSVAPCGAGHRRDRRDARARDGGGPRRACTRPPPRPHGGLRPAPALRPRAFPRPLRPRLRRDRDRRGRGARAPLRRSDAGGSTSRSAMPPTRSRATAALWRSRPGRRSFRLATPRRSSAAVRSTGRRRSATPSAASWADSIRRPCAG